MRAAATLRSLQACGTCTARPDQTTGPCDCAVRQSTRQTAGPCDRMVRQPERPDRMTAWYGGWRAHCRKPRKRACLKPYVAIVVRPGKVVSPVAPGARPIRSIGAFAGADAPASRSVGAA